MSVNGEFLGPEDERRHSELRAAIDRIAKAAAEHAGRRAGRRAAVGYFALVIVLLIGAMVYSRVQERKLQDGLTAACVRVNVLRVETNRDTQVVWQAFYKGRQRERLLARVGPQREAHRKTVVYLTKSIAALRWTPETDCGQAVDNAKRYRPPSSRPFTRRFLDLSVTPK